LTLKIHACIDWMQFYNSFIFLLQPTIRLEVESYNAICWTAYLVKEQFINHRYVELL